MPIRRGVVVTGILLLVGLFVAIFTIAIIGVLEGDGALGLKLIRGGKGGSVFPVALIPVFIAALVVGGFWIKRYYIGKHRSRDQRSSDNANERGK